MPNFYEMIEIMERDRPLDEDWKKWTLPAALAAGSLASAYRAVNYPTKPNDSRPAATSRAEEEEPSVGDARYEFIASKFGVGQADTDLAKRQSKSRMKIGGMGGEIEQGEDDGLGIGGMGGEYPSR